MHHRARGRDDDNDDEGDEGDDDDEGGIPVSAPSPSDPWPGRGRRVAAWGGFGVLFGVLGALGWHVQPRRGAIISIFGDPSAGPTRELLEAWTDMVRALWWPVVLGFPAAGLLLGVLAGLALGIRRRHAATARPVLGAGAFGVLLGTLGAWGWHYHPFALTEPPPLLVGAEDAEDAEERERIIAVIQAGPGGDRVDDWADPWWPAILGYPAAGALLGLGLGLVYRQRQRRTTEPATNQPSDQPGDR